MSQLNLPLPPHQKASETATVGKKAAAVSSHPNLHQPARGTKTASCSRPPPQPSNPTPEQDEGHVQTLRTDSEKTRTQTTAPPTLTRPPTTQKPKDPEEDAEEIDGEERDTHALPYRIIPDPFSRGQYRQHPHVDTEEPSPSLRHIESPIFDPSSFGKPISTGLWLFVLLGRNKKLRSCTPLLLSKHSVSTSATISRKATLSSKAKSVSIWKKAGCTILGSTSNP
jgi:hypothetical protein